MDVIQLKYTSSAWPSDGIQMNKVYSLGKDEDGSFIEGHGIKQYYAYELIKMMFSPIKEKQTWEEIDKPVYKKYK